MGRKKGSTSKDTPKSQPLPSLLPPPLIPITSLLAIPNLKMKRTEKETEEGKVVPPSSKSSQRQRVGLFNGK